MQFIKVRYVGKGDSILTEYDGIKYNFSKSKPVAIIPLVVYNFMQDYQNVHREDLVPFSDAVEESKLEKRSTLEDTISSIDESLSLPKESHEVKKRFGKRK